MRRRQGLVTLGVALALTLATGTATQAAAGAEAPAPSPSTDSVTYAAVWRMDEPAGATAMRDASGQGNQGRIGAKVETGVAVGGAAGYRFPGPAAAEDDARIVTVPDSPSLDPGTRSVLVSVTFRASAYGEYNLLQKGLSSSRGQYKLQWNADGRPQCTFKGTYDGSTRARTVGWDAALSLNTLHTVKCLREPGRIWISVDGQWAAPHNATIGSIRNGAPVTLGGKPTCRPECDYFRGELAKASIGYL